MRKVHGYTKSYDDFRKQAVVHLIP
jgi:hypothetical protein